MTSEYFTTSEATTANAEEDYTNPREYTDPNNRWLNNAPTTSDGANFMTMGMGGDGAPGGINVSPDGVKQFSSQTCAEAMDLMKNFQDGVYPLARETGNIGGSFIEAAYFVGEAGQGMERLSAFQADVSDGLRALGLGARTIALNYINGDATSAATMSDVEGAFDVSGGRGFKDMPVDPDAVRPVGQDAPQQMPQANQVFDLPERDPNGAQPIPLGSRDSYTVPAAAADDLERRNMQDLQELGQQYGDDLKHEGWTEENGVWAPPQPVLDLNRRDFA